VLARDNAGHVSWSSPPLTFTTGTPARSDCAARMSDVSDWSSGFVGGVHVTNTGTKPVTDWTLTFTWPTGRQHVTGGWNGTWTQSGTTVTVTSATALAPGESADPGFTADYGGPNILPSAFTLNGTLCAAA
jgi:cellulase/cellobiase CelA1